MNPGLMKTIKKPLFPEKLRTPNFHTSAAVLICCTSLRNLTKRVDGWISKLSTDSDLNFILLFPASHPIYTALSGDKKKKGPE